MFVKLRWFINRARKIEIILCLAAARTLIRVLPFRWLKKTMGRVGSPHHAQIEEPITFKNPPALRVRQIGLEIERMANRMPFKAVCLAQAMTGKWMLARRKVDAQIFLGARERSDGKRIDLHAWLIAEGQFVTGGDQTFDFKPFKTPDSSDSSDY